MKLSPDDEPQPEPRSNTELISTYPKLADPIEAIDFALGVELMSTNAVYDFLQTWRDEGWSEIEAAYPEFIEQVTSK